MTIIILLSDFGLVDPFVAEMKAVILSICPEARIVDISHDITKFDIRMGAFVLAQATPFFKHGSIHVAVVDPGVGTQRRAIVIETEDNLYVGPDNGILLFSAEKEGIKHVFMIENKKYLMPIISETFLGRDIFSCVAAYLGKGVSPSQFGPEINSLVKSVMPTPSFHGSAVIGDIVHIDSFGNIVSNITSKDIGKIGGNEIFSVLLRDKKFNLRLCRTYGDVEVGKPLMIVGSSGFLEFSINQGSASHKLGIHKGERIQIMK